MKLYPQFAAISSEYFTFNKDTKTFSCDISDLNGKLRWCALYDDAADIGFSMMSESSGKVATFSLINEVTDKDGDVHYWEFHPIHESIEENPMLKDVKVFVFND